MKQCSLYIFAISNMKFDFFFLYLHFTFISVGICSCKNTMYYVLYLWRLICALLTTASHNQARLSLKVCKDIKSIIYIGNLNMYRTSRYDIIVHIGYWHSFQYCMHLRGYLIILRTFAFTFWQTQCKWMWQNWND